MLLAGLNVLLLAIAQLEVGSFHLLSLLQAGLFGHVLTGLLFDLGRFRDVIRVLLAVSDLTVGALPQVVAPFAVLSPRNLHTRRRRTFVVTDQVVTALDKHRPAVLTRQRVLLGSSPDC